jgi:hypothetical protein
LRDANSVLQTRLTELLATSNEHVAELNLKAEEESRKRAQIELRLRKSRNRYLDDEEVSALKHAISRYRGQEFFITMPTAPHGTSSEPDKFGMQLDQIFRSEGWLLSPSSSPHALGQRFTSRIFPGVEITYGQGQQSTLAATELHRVLESFDIYLKPVMPEGYIPLSVVLINIGFAT